MNYTINKYCPLCSNPDDYPRYKERPFSIGLLINLDNLPNSLMENWIVYSVINYEGKCNLCQKNYYMNGTIRKSVSKDLIVLGDNLIVSSTLSKFL